MSQKNSKKSVKTHKIIIFRPFSLGFLLKSLCNQWPVATGCNRLPFFWLPSVAVRFGSVFLQLRQLNFQTLRTRTTSRDNFKSFHLNESNVSPLADKVLDDALRAQKHATPDEVRLLCMFHFSVQKSGLIAALISWQDLIYWCSGLRSHICTILWWTFRCFGLAVSFRFQECSEYSTILGYVSKRKPKKRWLQDGIFWQV